MDEIVDQQKCSHGESFFDEVDIIYTIPSGILGVDQPRGQHEQCKIF